MTQGAITSLGQSVLDALAERDGPGAGLTIEDLAWAIRPELSARRGVPWIHGIGLASAALERNGYVTYDRRSRMVTLTESGYLATSAGQAAARDGLGNPGAGRAKRVNERAEAIAFALLKGLQPSDIDDADEFARMCYALSEAMESRAEVTAS